MRYRRRGYRRRRRGYRVRSVFRRRIGTRF